MGKVTFVIDYPDGQEPKVSFNTDVLGGQLKAVLWSDYRDDLLTGEELEVIEGSFDDCETFGNRCEELSVNPDELVEKLRLLHK